jgi:hypothetical protein
MGHKVPAPRPGYQADDIRELIRELNGATRDAKTERHALEAVRRDIAQEIKALDQHVIHLLDVKGAEVRELVEREVRTIEGFFAKLNVKVREHQAQLLGANNPKELLKDLHDGVIAALSQQVDKAREETEERQNELMKDINRKIARIVSR